MSRFASFPNLHFLLVLSVLFLFAQGCCGIASGPSVAEVERWMSVIRDGDSGDKVVALLRERGFYVDDYRLSQRSSPDSIRKMRERRIDVASLQYHHIWADRVTDMCILTLVNKRVIVRVQLDANDRVIYTSVDEEVERPQWP